MTVTSVAGWHGDHATVQSMLDESTTKISDFAVVMATPNMALSELELDLEKLGVQANAIGDCVAPRNAAFAFFEGRKLGLKL